MTFTFSALSIIYFLTFGVIMISLSQVLKHRKKRGGRELLFLLAALGFWALMAAFEAAVNEHWAKVFWGKISYFGIASSPVFMLLFTFKFTDNERMLERQYQRILWLVPIITLILVLTNDYHGLIWKDIVPANLPGMNLLVYEYGIWFWVFLIYDYFLFMLTFIILAISVFRFRYIYSRQILVLLIPFIISWVGNIISILKIEVIRGLDLTPITFSIVGIVLSWGLAKLELFNLTPIAKDIIVDKMNDCLLVVNSEMRLVDFNQASETLFYNPKFIHEFKQTHVIGQKVTELFAHWPELLEIITAQDEGQFEIDFFSLDGRRNYQLNLTQLLDNHQKPLGKMAVLNDITNQKKIIKSEMGARRTAEALQGVAQVIGSTLDYNNILSLSLDEIRKVIPYDTASIALLEGEKLIIRMNRDFENPDVFDGFELDYGYSPNKVALDKGEPVIFDDIQSMFSTYAEEPHNQTRSILCIPMHIKDKAVGTLTLDSRQLAAFDPEQLPMAKAFAAQVAVALENSRLFEQMTYMAIRDPLLGVFNRRHFIEVAEVELKRAQRYKHSLTLVLMDIDLFKNINDSYGHLVGDQALKQTAQACSSSLRSCDVFARYGGEEFAFLMPETPLEEGIKAAERLRQAVSGIEIDTKSGVTRITASFGVAASCSENDSIDSLLSGADQALYQAKHAGRNMVCFIEESH